MRKCEYPKCPSPARTGRWCRFHYVRLGYQAEANERAARYVRPDWRALRAQVLREQPICATCQKREATMVDHIVEVRDGGTNARSNLAGLCWVCHSRKTLERTTRGKAAR